MNEWPPDDPRPPDADGTVAETPLPPAPAYGDFEVVRRADGTLWELGRGAMGITYRARDCILERPVALKVIRDVGGTVRERFLREARAAAALRHANVAGIFQFGVSEDSGTCFYAMELVEGETVEARVRREGPLSAAVALDIAAQVANALVAAAARGLIHRDLKPSNLLLTTGDNTVKVVDFGLAKAVTSTIGQADLTHGGFVGTPAYASPEQFRPGSVDERSDFYSLGVTLWFMLTGRAPFSGRTLEEWRTHPAREDLPFDQLSARRVPEPAIVLLRRVLAVKPDARPASARELLEDIGACRRDLGVDSARTERKGQRARVALAAFVACLVIAAAVLGLWRRHGRGGVGIVELPIPVTEKSIAVLPFKNLGDIENGYFAEGVQDEILTDLARIADLKVISQTSVMAYLPSHPGSVRDIAAALGVTHLLEGSVQRIGTRVRVTAKLIDARSDREVWAERYDNDLADIFRIQSEIAQAIAGNLRAKLSNAEKAAIDAPPTADVAAYDLYLRAKELVLTYSQTADWRETLLRAIRLLDEAVARDDKFALAHCIAAKAHSDLYLTGLDHTPARLALLEHAAAEALRLAPNLGESHLARALYLYRARQFPEARAELAIASAVLPNDVDVLILRGYIGRREGHWPEARADFERALALDPNNYDVINEVMVVYDHMRLYAEFARVAESAIGRLPAYADYFRLMKAEIYLEAGRPEATRTILAALPAGYDPNGAATYARVMVALYQGRIDEAMAVAAAFKGTEYPGINGETVPRAWFDVYIARAAHDAARAKSALEGLRETLAASVAARPGNAITLVQLGLADAGLGRKDDAIAEGRQAVDLLPVSKDAMDGPAMLGALAMIYTWAGEPEQAMDILNRLKDTVGGTDYGQLRFDPAWASVRNRPDFQAMLKTLDPGPVP